MEEGAELEQYGKRLKKPSAAVIAATEVQSQKRHRSTAAEMVVKRQQQEADKAMKALRKQQKKDEKEMRAKAKADNGAKSAAIKPASTAITEELEIRTEAAAIATEDRTPLKKESKEERSSSEIKAKSRWTKEETIILINAVSKFNADKKTQKRLRSSSSTEKWLIEIPKNIAALGGVARMVPKGGSLSSCPNKGRFEKIAAEAKDYINHKNVEDGEIYERGGKQPPTGSGLEENGEPDERFLKWTQEQEAKKAAKKAYFDELSEEKKEIFEYYYQAFPLTEMPCISRVARQARSQEEVTLMEATIGQSHIRQWENSLWALNKNGGKNSGSESGPEIVRCSRPSWIAKQNFFQMIANNHDVQSIRSLAGIVKLIRHVVVIARLLYQNDSSINNLHQKWNSIRQIHETFHRFAALVFVLKPNNWLFAGCSVMVSFNHRRYYFSNPSRYSRLPYAELFPDCMLIRFRCQISNECCARQCPSFLQK